VSVIVRTFGTPLTPTVTLPDELVIETFDVPLTMFDIVSDAGTLALIVELELLIFCSSFEVLFFYYLA
jgi:hypothetical protein